jgi:hypothetical protein
MSLRGLRRNQGEADHEGRPGRGPEGVWKVTKRGTLEPMHVLLVFSCKRAFGRMSRTRLTVERLSLRLLRIWRMLMAL